MLAGDWVCVAVLPGDSEVCASDTVSADTGPQSMTLAPSLPNGYAHTGLSHTNGVVYPEQVGVLVLGAGPTGLGAATRLHQHGASDWLLIDQAEGPGGLSCTEVTQEGFLFDLGGHVTYSHYDYFDQLVHHALGSGPEVWNTMERVSYVYIKNRWVPYPLQDNISALDKDDQVNCLLGVVEARLAWQTATGAPQNFDEWILQNMGTGLAELFMRPYNFKVWAVPTTEMQHHWLGDRAARVDLKKAITTVIHGQCDAQPGWGLRYMEDKTFYFPKRGGTGAIFKAIGDLLPADKQRYGPNMKVAGIDKDNKTVVLASGRQIKYDSLLSTLPLDLTLRWLGKTEWADSLTHSTSNILGIGIRGECPLGLKCWMYFAEDNCPFYRVTVFSNYAAENCPSPDQKLPTLIMGNGEAPKDKEPKAGPFWSLMFEVSESPARPVAMHPVRVIGGQTWSAIVAETIQGALNTHLINADSDIVSIYHKRLEHGYPTPSLGRDAVLEKALPWLRQHGIWSRGRFGNYKYEIGNQDHSLMLGVEAVDNILFGTKEMTLHHPNIINAKKNTELTYTPTMMRHPSLKTDK